jgi:6,7-dimethyl-8-ribityllumazine synthase
MAHVMLVEARFYPGISEELAQGAIAALERGGATYDRFAVPGAFEIPAAIAFAALAQAEGGARRQYDGYVALGCVIRGETTHYDYVCQESARGLQKLAIERGLAIGYGIITVENEAQAWARARIGEKNRGGAAAEACLRLIGLRRELGLAPR